MNIASWLSSRNLSISLTFLNLSMTLCDLHLKNTSAEEGVYHRFSSCMSVLNPIPLEDSEP